MRIIHLSAITVMIRNARHYVHGIWQYIVLSKHRTICEKLTIERKWWWRSQWRRPRWKWWCYDDIVDCLQRIFNIPNSLQLTTKNRVRRQTEATLSLQLPGTHYIAHVLNSMSKHDVKIWNLLHASGNGCGTYWNDFPSFSIRHLWRIPNVSAQTADRVD